MFALSALSALTLAANPTPSAWPADLKSGEVAVGVTEHVFSGSGCDSTKKVFDVPIPGPCTDPTDLPNGGGQAWWAGLAVGSGQGVLIGYGATQDDCLSSIALYAEKFPSACEETTGPDGETYSFIFDGSFPCSSEQKKSGTANSSSNSTASATINWSKKMLALSEAERLAEFQKFHRAATSKPRAAIVKSAVPTGSAFANALRKHVTLQPTPQIDITFGGSAMVFSDDACTIPVSGNSADLIQIPGLCSVQATLPWAGPAPVFAAAVCIISGPQTSWIGGGGGTVQDCWKGLIESQDAHGTNPGQCEQVNPDDPTHGYIKISCAKGC
jgi:hypothetical protein